MENIPANSSSCKLKRELNKTGFLTKGRLMVILRQTLRGYTIQTYYRTRALLTQALFGQRYNKSQYLRYFSKRGWKWEWVSPNKLKWLVQRGHVVVRILDGQLQRGHRRPICAHRRSSIPTNAATDRPTERTDRQTNKQTKGRQT